MNDKDAQQEIDKAWVEACNGLAQAFIKHLSALVQPVSVSDWPEVVYEDILDAETVEF